MVAVVLVVDALHDCPQQGGGHANVHADGVPEGHKEGVRSFCASLKGEKPCGDLDIDVPVVRLECIGCSRLAEGQPRNVVFDHFPVW